jgi:hypothetical protein
MKTLILTESQIRNVINRVIEEQGKNQPFSVNFENAFDSGQYEINPNYKNIINKNIVDIIDHIKNENLKNFVITIQGGESQVPNPLNPETNLKFGKGELAKKRSEVLKRYLDSVFPKTLGFSPNIEVKEPIIGNTKWDGINKDDQKYKNEQFIKVSVVITNNESPTPTPKKSDVEERIYKNNKLIGFISEPFVDSKSESDPGFKSLGTQELIFTEVKPDTVPRKDLSKYKVPFEWWNKERSNPGTSHISDEDLNYIRKFPKIS